MQHPTRALAQHECALIERFADVGSAFGKSALYVFIAGAAVAASNKALWRIVSSIRAMTCSAKYS
jgi:hypothetical protein